LTREQKLGTLCNLSFYSDLFEKKINSFLIFNAFSAGHLDWKNLYSSALSVTFYHNFQILFFIFDQNFLGQEALENFNQRPVSFRGKLAIGEVQRIIPKTLFQVKTLEAPPSLWRDMFLIA
jgi:hypothetical protein